MVGGNQTDRVPALKELTGVAEGKDSVHGGLHRAQTRYLQPETRPQATAVPGTWYLHLCGGAEPQALPATCFAQDTAQNQTNFTSAFTRLEGVEERGLPRKPEKLVPPLSSYGQMNRSAL